MPSDRVQAHSSACPLATFSAPTLRGLQKVCLTLIITSPPHSSHHQFRQTALQPFQRPQEPASSQMQRLRNAALWQLAQQVNSSPDTPLAGAGCPPPAARQLRRAAGAAQSPVSLQTRLPMQHQSLSMLRKKDIARQQQVEAWPKITQLQQVQDASSMSALSAHSRRFCMCCGCSSKQRGCASTCIKVVRQTRELPEAGQGMECVCARQHACRARLHGHRHGPLHRLPVNAQALVDCRPCAMPLIPAHPPAPQHASQASHS